MAASIVKAVSEGDLPALAALLDADPDLVNAELAASDERRAIHFAVMRRDAAMVALLVERGADPRKGVYPYRDLTSALRIAELRGYGELVPLLEAARPRASPQAAVTPEPPLESLWHAVVKTDLAKAGELLAAGVDPNAVVDASGSPMFQAYCLGDPRMIELLARFGGKADEDSIGHFRMNGEARARASELNPEQLLWSAACGGAPEIAAIALEQIDWPAGDTRWYRILREPLYFWNHMPYFWEKPEWDRTTYLACFRLILVRSGPNLCGRFGLTIPHEIAAMRDYVTPAERESFARAYLDAGGRTDARDDLLLKTPLDWARLMGREELIHLFAR
jgi:hypothetical protein